MHLKKSFLIVLQFLASSWFIVHAQTVDLGCMTDADQVVGLDRKDWNNGDISLHSEASMLNFDLPENTFGDCKKITSITLEVTINNVDISGLAPGCLPNIFFLNLYVDSDLPFDPASVSTNQELVGNNSFGDVFDISDTYVFDCGLNGVDFIFDGQFGVDIIPIPPNFTGCPFLQTVITDGGYILEWEACVSVEIGDSGTPPTAEASSLNTNGTDEYCIGDAWGFIESGGDAESWEWSGPDGFSSPFQTPSLLDFSLDNVGTYTVTVTDAAGCTSTDEVTLGLGASPVAMADAVNLEVCPGQSIELLETGGEGDTWSWGGPNGFTSPSQNPVITFSNAASLGTYLVIVTDGNSCSSTSEVEIVAAPLPDANADAVLTEICPGQDIELLENGGVGTMWSWEGPDGFSSNDQNPIISTSTIDDLGLYSVTVTDAGGCTNTSTVTIDPGTPPNADADAVDFSVCDGADINLLEIGGDGVAWSWSGPNSFTSNDQDPTIGGITNAEIGTYTVTVTSFEGCTATSQVNISLADNPTGFISGTGVLCESECTADDYFFELEPATGIFDIDLTFPGTGIADFSLSNISDGYPIFICSDPLAGNVDFDGVNLTLPTNGLTDGQTISVQIGSLTDTNDPSCTGVPDFSEEIQIVFSTAANPLIEYEGSVLMDGTVLNCITDFNPTIDVAGIDGTWTIDGDLVFLPVDLTSYPTGDHTLTFTPNSDECAFEVEVLIEVEPCASCVITDALLADINCDNNSTGGDNTDDIITFSLDPQAVFEGATYEVMVSSGTVSPSMGTYGTITDFELQAGSAGAGDVMITIQDVDEGTCFIVVNLIDPGSCSGACEITSAVVVTSVCNDNGTAADDSDDFITFELEVEGDNTGGGYNISSVLGMLTGNYGVTESFDFPLGSAGGNDVVLTITDSADGTCETTVTVMDPGTCSGACSIDPVVATDVQCFNNLTAGDPSDDLLLFDLNPTGSNLTGDYTITSTYGINPPVATFGMNTGFTTDFGTATGGTFMVTITSVDDPTCSDTFTIVDPGSCSDECTLSDPIVAVVTCDPNNTDTDPSDDIINFQLQVDGFNVGSGYSFTNMFGTFNGNYGVVEDFQMPMGSATAGDFILNIVDNDDANCTTQVSIVNPGPCSGGCNITDAMITSIMCDANGTDSDDTDDFIIFTIAVDGTNVGTGYSFDTPFGMFTGNYGMEETIELPLSSAGTGNFMFTIIDNDDNSCTVTLSLTDPGTCSGACSLDLVTAENVVCNDNNTPADQTDDFLTFELNPQGTNLTGSYEISSSYDINPSMGAFGGPTLFTTTSLAMNGGTFSVTLTSVDDPSCTTTFDIDDPGQCSEACLISANLTAASCDPNNTDTDPTDDILFIEIEVVGGSSPSGYTIDSPFGTFMGAYGVNESFELTPGSAGAGSIVLTITDNDDLSCSLDFTVLDANSCSGACSLDDATAMDVACDDNGTPDETDDFLIFDINPQGANLVGDYTITSTEYAITPSSGSFGGTETFETDGLSMTGGTFSITITSDDDPNCTITVDVNDPGPCSESCIVNAMIGNITCDDNGTDMDPTDDIFIFELDVEGIGGSTGYNFVSPGGFLGGDYGTVSEFEMGPGTAGDGDIDITIVDNDNPACTTTITISDPGVCSGDCISDVDVIDVVCFDNQTASTTNDDFLTITIMPTSAMTGQYSFSTDFAVSPSSGTFGQESTFATGSLNQNGGILTVTIVANNDPSCTFTFEVVDPGPCSIACPDPGDCDDGDDCNGIETWNDDTCVCNPGVGGPDPSECVDDGDCSNGEEVWDEDTCSCISENLVDPSSCVDDGDCTNGLEFWDDETCECLTEEPLDCNTGGGIEMPCDDGFDFTENDVEIVLACDGTVCIPCQGSLQDPNIFFPQIFSPNGDGDNDDWGLFSNQDFLIEELNIYDRWGDLLYTVSDVMRSDDRHKWNGRFQGDVVISGVYVYYVKLGDPFNTVLAGDLTLVH